MGLFHIILLFIVLKLNLNGVFPKINLQLMHTCNKTSQYLEVLNLKC